jgi:hypothetical protein
MAARLEKTLAAIPVAPKAARTVSEEDARKLEALGYVQ